MYTTCTLVAIGVILRSLECIKVLWVFIWFLFHILQLLPISRTQPNSCLALATLRLYIFKYWIKFEPSPNLVMVIGSVCLLIS
jgi:hypothetical protein